MFLVHAVKLAVGMSFMIEAPGASGLASEQSC
jgi:hypothetical protein